MNRERTLIHPATPRENFNAYVSDDVETIYADGINRVNITGGISRIELYLLEMPTAAGTSGTSVPGSPPEERIVLAYLAMPTKSLTALLVNVLQMLKANEAGVTTAAEVDLQALKQLLASVEVKPRGQ